MIEIQQGDNSRRKIDRHIFTDNDSEDERGEVEVDGWHVMNTPKMTSLFRRVHPAK